MNNWKDSKTFCVYPWMHQEVKTDGKYSPCCVTSPSKIIDPSGNLTVDTHTFEQARNSEGMCEMRRKMLAGEDVNQCKNCYAEEALGKFSYRQRNNEMWIRALGLDLEARIKYSEENDFKINAAPVYLDLRLGNLCNLQCKSCSPWNSSQIQKETLNLISNNKEYERLWRAVYGHAPDPIPIWYESKQFWNEIKGMAPSLKKIYMTGGEPTLIEKNYELMQYLVDNGYTDIELFFNLNCTNIKGRFFDLLKQFSNVSINASIDGYGKLQEYIRYPSKWKSIEENFLQLTEYPNIRLGITPVLQAYNVLGLVELMYYVEDIYEKTDANMLIDILINYQPHHTSPWVIPKDIRAEGAARLQTFVNNSKLCQGDAFTKNSIQSAIEFLKQTPPKEYKTIYRQQFITYTHSLDNHRDHFFRDNNPELWGELHDAGITI